MKIIFNKPLKILVKHKLVIFFAETLLVFIYYNENILLFREKAIFKITFINEADIIHNEFFLDD